MAVPNAISFSKRAAYPVSNHTYPLLNHKRNQPSSQNLPKTSKEIPLSPNSYETPFETHITPKGSSETIGTNNKPQ